MSPMLVQTAEDKHDLQNHLLVVNAEHIRYFTTAWR